MKQLFITKSTIDYGLDTATGDIAGSWDVTALSEGSLAVFDGDGALLDDTTPSITTSDFQIALGTAEGEPIMSPMLDRTSLTFEKQAYSAAVAPIKYLGSDEDAGNTNGYSLNLPSSISAGDVVGLYVTDLSKPHYDTSRTKYYSYRVKSGDTLTGEVANNIIYELVAVINADSGAIVTAALHDDGAGNNDGIKFTANTAGVDFSISVDDNVLANADIVDYTRVNGVYDASATNGTKYAVDQGGPTWLAGFEKELSSYEGNNNSYYMNDLLWDVANKTSSSGTYTVYTLTCKTPDDDVLIREDNPIITVYIAVPSADTGAGEHIFALDNILAVL